MNQWLSNKKNLPIVIGAVVLLLILAGLLIAFETGLFNAAPEQAAVAPPPPPSPTGNLALNRPGNTHPGRTAALPPHGPSPFAPPARLQPGSQAGGAFGHPAAGKAPGSAAAPANIAKLSPVQAIESSNLTPAQKKAMLDAEAKITPDQKAAYEKMTPEQKLALGKKILSGIASVAVATPAASRNPFAPTFNAQKLRTSATPPAVSTFVPFAAIAQLPSSRGGTTLYPVQNTPQSGPATVSVPLGRVAGIINSNGIRAIYEIDGQDTIVTPGSLLPENGGRVQSIQSDGITVRLPESRQTVQVPITAGNPASNNGAAGGGGALDNSPSAPDNGSGQDS